jgi:polyketide synthase 5
MALAAAHAVLGEAAEVRDVNFDRALPLDEPATVSTSVSVSVASSGIAKFTVDADHKGEQARLASAVLHAAEHDQPPAYDISALLAAHPQREDGAEIRNRMNRAGVQYGSAFSGLVALRSGGRETTTVLAEVTLPRQMRSQQDGYGVHPALLDACFQSVAAHPDVQALSEDVVALPSAVARLRSYAAARTGQYCYARVTRADGSGVQADLDLLDEHGAVLLAVQGLQLAAGTSTEDVRDRVLCERLLAVEWQRATLPERSDADSGNWLVITAAADDVLAVALPDALAALGAQCTTVNWPRDADVTAHANELKNHLRTGRFSGLVILAGLSEAGDEDRSPLLGLNRVTHLVAIIREVLEAPAGSPRLYVVTRNAQAVVPSDIANLAQAGVRGLMRVIGAEHPHLRAAQIDFDEATDPRQLAQQLLSGSDEDESAWRVGSWYTARLSKAPLQPKERRTAVADLDRDGVRVQIRTSGAPEWLDLVACERTPPGPGQIEVAISASGINFTDVLIATGRFPSFDGYLPQLGTDFAGVVTAVGPGVTEHHVGDHVGGIADGCWRTFVTCAADSAVPLPAGLSDSQAAAVTTAHATAWYGLHDLARIDSGDKVLIHSATGGVGQAAIAIARAAGADIFATAGSPDRRQMLRDMGIEHVYDSRSVEFAEKIRRDTGDAGVDIVLNSVTGAAQRAGIDILAFGGRFVEIGKRDIYRNTRLGLSSFRRNLSFHAVDLALMSQSHPKRLRDLLCTVYGLVADGELPMPQSTKYPITDAADAIRVMSEAQHTGKLVLDITRVGSISVVVPPAQVPVFRPDGAYLITGGLGNLGLFLAEKMAAAGCGRIVLSSRSQPTAAAGQTIERIRATGTDVLVVCGDIADPAATQRLVAAATASGLPVRGVLHLEAVREDATLSNVTDESIEREWGSRVYGGWNLHIATTGQPLDWFCCFSSAAALVGSPGQGAYAAANAWLDAFSSWRRGQGLPATTIAWATWTRIGHGPSASADSTIAPEDGVYALETLLRHDRGCTGYAPATGTTWLTASHRSTFTEALHSGQHAASKGRLHEELNLLPADERPTRLRRLISDQVSLILRRKIDPDRPLAEYGVDSLGALELRSRIETETGIRLTSGDIATTSIRDLATLVSEKLAPVESV